MKQFFTTRLNRKKYILYTIIPSLPYILIGCVCIVEMLFGASTLSITVIDNVEAVINGLDGSYYLLLFVILLFTSIRRLHDIGMSGWWFLITFIPCIGSFFLVYLLLKKGGETNKWGGPV